MALYNYDSFRVGDSFFESNGNGGHEENGHEINNGNGGPGIVARQPVLYPAVEMDIKVDKVPTIPTTTIQTPSLEKFEVDVVKMSQYDETLIDESRVILDQSKDLLDNEAMYQVRRDTLTKDETTKKTNSALTIGSIIAVVGALYLLT